MDYNVNILAKDVANFLNANLIGEENVRICKVSSIEDLDENSIAFLKKKDFKLENLLSKKKIAVLIPENLLLKDISIEKLLENKIALILVKNPRLAFAKVINRFFYKRDKKGIHPTAIIGKNCSIGNNVYIGAYTVIGDNVVIGDNTIINNHVVIYNGVKIGKNCYIKSGSIIGEDGFGFDFDEKVPIRIPHIGGVVIGDNVEIGSKCTINRGTIGNTIINRNVKIDDQVHIAHNCIIGENTIITACAEISGSVKIGKNCWIAPNTSIIQKVVIGDNVKIGIGCTVVSDIPSGKTIMGLEGIDLRKLIRIKKSIDWK